MSDDVILQMVPTNTYDCNIINLRGRQNIYIEGGNLIGERAEHTLSSDKTTDEECNDITAYYANHIFLNHMKISSAHGDGVLLFDRGRAEGQTVKHIIIANSEFNDNFRQGISVVGVSGLRITGNEIHHTSGTEPQFGIDFEGAGRVNEKVIVDNNYFHDNKGGDIVNNDVQNLFVEYNRFSSGELTWMVDNTFIPKGDSSYILYRNNFEKTVGSTGCGYTICCSYGTNMEQKNPSFFVENTIGNGRLMLTNRNKVCISDNTVNGQLSGYNLQEMRLYNNKVTSSGIRYSFQNVRGKASGNQACRENEDCFEVTDLEKMNDTDEFNMNLSQF